MLSFTWLSHHALVKYTQNLHICLEVPQTELFRYFPCSSFLRDRLSQTCPCGSLLMFGVFRQAPPAVSLEARFAEPALVLLGLPQNWIVLVKILPKGNKLCCLPSGLAHTRERGSRGVHRANSSSQKQHSFLTQRKEHFLKRVLLFTDILYTSVPGRDP